MEVQIIPLCIALGSIAGVTILVVLFTCLIRYQQRRRQRLAEAGKGERPAGATSTRSDGAEGPAVAPSEAGGRKEGRLGSPVVGRTSCLLARHLYNVAAAANAGNGSGSAPPMPSPLATSPVVNASSSSTPGSPLASNQEAPGEESRDVVSAMWSPGGQPRTSSIRGDSKPARRISRWEPICAPSVLSAIDPEKQAGAERAPMSPTLSAMLNSLLPVSFREGLRRLSSVRASATRESGVIGSSVAGSAPATPSTPTTGIRPPWMTSSIRVSTGAAAESSPKPTPMTAAGAKQGEVSTSLPPAAPGDFVVSMSLTTANRPGSSQPQPSPKSGTPDGKPDATASTRSSAGAAIMAIVAENLSKKNSMQDGSAIASPAASTMSTLPIASTLPKTIITTTTPVSEAPASDPSVPTSPRRTVGDPGTIVVKAKTPVDYPNSSDAANRLSLQAALYGTRASFASLSAVEVSALSTDLPPTTQRVSVNNRVTKGTAAPAQPSISDVTPIPAPPTLSETNPLASPMSSTPRDPADGKADNAVGGVARAKGNYYATSLYSKMSGSDGEHRTLERPVSTSSGMSAVTSGESTVLDAPAPTTEADASEKLGDKVEQAKTGSELKVTIPAPAPAVAPLVTSPVTSPVAAVPTKIVLVRSPKSPAMSVTPTSPQQTPAGRTDSMVSAGGVLASPKSVMSTMTPFTPSSPRSPRGGGSGFSSARALDLLSKLESLAAEAEAAAAAVGAGRSSTSSLEDDAKVLAPVASGNGSVTGASGIVVVDAARFGGSRRSGEGGSRTSASGASLAPGWRARRRRSSVLAVPPNASPVTGSGRRHGGATVDCADLSRTSTGSLAVADNRATKGSDVASTAAATDDDERTCHNSLSGSESERLGEQLGSVKMAGDEATGPTSTTDDVEQAERGSVNSFSSAASARMAKASRRKGMLAAAPSAPASAGKASDALASLADALREMAGEEGASPVTPTTMPSWRSQPPSSIATAKIGDVATLGSPASVASVVVKSVAESNASSLFSVPSAETDAAKRRRGANGDVRPAGKGQLHRQLLELQLQIQEAVAEVSSKRTGVQQPPAPASPSTTSGDTLAAASTERGLSAASGRNKKWRRSSVVGGKSMRRISRMDDYGGSEWSRGYDRSFWSGKSMYGGDLDGKSIYGNDDD
ncbi:hypothetical protein HDU96_006709 [Phlyctochytrium bullatum]|nr:hypothetical protein HDU96_006709 [Phlyctochytrium bullatum]